MPKPFSDQVPHTNVAFELLPFYHTCSAYKAKRFIGEGRIFDDTDCEVFNEKITYLFYGRPAYKYQVASESNRDLSLYPVCFMLDGTRCGTLKRIFPFDTGAMYHNLYKSYFNPQMTVFDFEMDPSISRAIDLVARFYGTNAAYEGYRPKKFKALDTADFESLCYAEMIRSLSATPADERRATIELQAQENVDISAGVVQGMIVPGQLYRSSMFRLFAERNKFILHPYDITTWNPALCFGIMQNEAKKLSLKMKAKRK